MIQPRNDPEVCKKLADILELNLSQLIRIQPNPKSPNRSFPYPPHVISISDLFEYWLNICEVPPKYFFNIMSYFTEDELYKEKLQTMGANTTDGKLEYFDYCVKPRRTVDEILFDFDSMKIPLEYLIEAIGTQKCRDYSISSSSILHPKEVEHSTSSQINNFFEDRSYNGKSGVLFEVSKEEDRCLQWMVIKSSGG